MFRGDDVELTRVLGAAVRAARELGHPRVGSEHVLLAFVERGMVSADGVREKTRSAAPLGAGVARPGAGVACAELPAGSPAGSPLTSKSRPLAIVASPVIWTDAAAGLDAPVSLSS